ncbi:MAG: hypothetical protein RLZZ306_1455 [Bacteroidota bacterium]|jgi:hypothetical protein
MKNENIVTNLMLAKTEQEIESSMNAINDAIKVAAPEEKKVLNNVLLAKTRMMINEIDEALKECDTLLSTPEFVIDLNEWITMKEYTKRFHLSSTNVVSNWIKRGLVPASNIRVLPMLNNLKLIKAVKYL